MVSILFTIVPDYGNGYKIKENKKWTGFEYFAPKRNLNHSIYTWLTQKNKDNFGEPPQKTTSQLSVHCWRMDDWESPCYRLKVSQLYQFTCNWQSTYCQSQTLSNFFSSLHHKSSWNQWMLLIQPIYSLLSTMFCKCNLTTNNSSFWPWPNTRIISFVTCYMVFGPLSLISTWLQGS